MNDNEIRLKIAELKGWVITPAGFEDYGFIDGVSYAINKDTILAISGGHITFPDRLPNWPTDIAAAWELEESIPAEQRENYIDALFEITKVDDSTMYWDGVSWATYDGLWAFIHATPRTRCLAWLKWKGVEVD